MSKSASAVERDALRGVRRACYAGYDSITLRQEVVRRAAPALPSEAYSLATVDPDTGLLTHVVREGVPPEFGRHFLRVVYPQVEAELMLDLARSGRIVSAEPSAPFREAIRMVGLEHELRAMLAASGSVWGIWCSLRSATSAPFGDREAAFLRRVAPHVAQGLRTAALLSASRQESSPDQPESTLPGVIAVDARGAVTLRTTRAAQLLADIADVGGQTGELPLSVAGVVGCVRAPQSYAVSALDADRPLGAWLRVRGRSGRWYTLRASLAEPDASGESAVVVMICPAERAEVAPILLRLYGLSPREREVLALVARGETTRSIARTLRLSTYTVQDHLDRAFDKVGVRGRRALLAKLFFDGYAGALESA